MATISSVDSAGKFRVTLEVTETSTSNANNTSTISWSFYITSLGYGGFSGYSIPRTATINGTKVVDSSASTQCLNNQTTNWGTGTQTITHDNDGSKTIAISFSAKGLGDYSWSGTISSTGTVALTDIPRASTLSLSPTSLTITSSNISSGSLTCSVTAKASYYHELTYRIESGSEHTVWSAQSVTVATSPKTVTISYADIASALGSLTTGVLTATLKTYTTSSKTTQVGSAQTATCQVTLSTSSVKPTVVVNSITTTAEDGPIANYLVAGYSKARIAYTVTLPTGASSASTVVTIAVDGETIGTLSSTGTTGTVISKVLPSSTSNYTISVTAVSTDDRGAVSNKSSAKTKTVYAYAAPKITGKFYRVAASGDTTQDPSGAYVYWTYSATQSYTVNSQNAITSLTAKKNGATVSDNPGWASLSTGSTATLVVTAIDSVTTATKTYKIGSAVFALDLYDDNAGAVGAGFGAPAKSGYVKSGLPIEVVSNDNLLLMNSAGIYSSETIGNNTRILGLVNDRLDTMVNANSRALYLGYSNTSKLRLYAPEMDYVNAGDITNMFCDNFITTGITVNNSRATIVSGGYMVVGKWVFVNMTFTIDVADIGTSYYLIFNNFPMPARHSALSCAIHNTAGAISAFIRTGNSTTNGQLCIAPSVAIAQGKTLMVSGMYIKA